MNLPSFSRCLTKGTYHVCRWVVILVVALLLLLAAAFVFLRVHGVPGPLLREALRRVHAAGIPVEVDRVVLTLNGWRAENLRYYSKNPDDIEPLLHSAQTYFSVRNSKRASTGSRGWNMDVKAVGLDMAPPVAWKVEIPSGHPILHADSLAVSLDFLPDRIVLSDGRVNWLGSRFRVEGTVLKGKRKGKRKGKAPGKRALPPGFLNAKKFQELEQRLSVFSFPHGADVDLVFVLDMADYSASQLSFSCKADQPGIKGVAFSAVELSGNYAYPQLSIDRARLSQGKESVSLKGTYRFDDKQVQGVLENTLSGTGLLRVFPGDVENTLDRLGVRLRELPRLKAVFGPAPFKELAENPSGSFSIRNAAYKDLVIEKLRGRVEKRGKRIDFLDLHGVAAGQEGRAAKGGSGMRGGPAAGTAFWDGNTRVFGVDIDASLDPNILVGVLSRFRVATNIIQRFQFPQQPPAGHVSLGKTIGKKGTFYIDIQARATNAVFRGVPLDTVKLTEAYTNLIVRLDSIDATQGTRRSSGSVTINLNNKTASFDISSDLNPVDIEQLVNPRFKLFKRSIKFAGKTHTVGKGTFDWGTMQKTDFTAQIKATKVTHLLGEIDQLSADITGKGPDIAVENVSFDLYGGKGEGSFSLSWKPGRKQLPYKTNLSLSGVDFHDLLVFFGLPPESHISGQLEGTASITADFSTNFCDSARGAGFVRVERGQLTDLPLFRAFSRTMRRVFPGFKVFSITSLRANFTIADGAVYSSDAYFGGDLISAKGEGMYRFSSGFDAIVQVQTLNESLFSKMLRTITDPIMKLFELRLTGPIKKPSWEMKNF